MTLKELHASSVASGASSNKGGSRLTGFWEDFRDSFGGVGEAASEPPLFDRGAMSSAGGEAGALEPFLRSAPFECASPLLKVGVVASGFPKAGISPS